MFQIITFLTLSLYLTFGFDAWDVLSTELTCCSLHATSETGCVNEAGSTCVWLDEDDPVVQDPDTEGQCFGEKYIECKKSNAECCGLCPGNPDPPDNPKSKTAGGLPPSDACGPAPTLNPAPQTPNPTTPAPTSACTLGVNYAFSGTPCVISGDPHTKIVNGNNHDFQGQPAKDFSDENLELKNQFYYFHPCIGSTTEDMPITVLATHYHWGDRSVSGVDYLTVILHDRGEKYNVFLSSSLHDYSIETGSSTVYEDNEPADMTALVADEATFIGDFRVIYSQRDHKTIFVQILIHGTEEFTLYMQGQTSYVDRFRMHYVQMHLPESMKCHSCGLCGDYKRPMTGLYVEQLEGCNGELVDYRAGFNAAVTPEAYDPDGWTWERQYVDNECGNYDITDNNGDDFEWTDPCDASIRDDVAAECLRQRNERSSCCDDIGGTFCAELVNDCEIDACAGANGDASKIEAEVTKVFGDAIDLVCTLPDAGLDNIPDPDLSCPSGSVQVGSINADIWGCGLEGCDNRYDYRTIEDCEEACTQNSDCDSYNWAPINGDKNHPTQKVCTLYDVEAPTSDWGPNQIFCKLQRSTCTLKSYNIADDITQIRISKDGGASWSDGGYMNCWHCTLGDTIEGITTDTIIRYEVHNNNGPGGFIATLNLVNDLDAAKTYQIVSNSPLTTFDVISGASKSDLTYWSFGAGSPWAGITITTDPDISAVAYWSWNGQVNNDIVYQIDFSDDQYASILEELGCIQQNTVDYVAVNHHISRKSNSNGGIINNDNTLLSTSNELFYYMIGIISMLLLCSGVMYYRRSKSKYDKYIPIKDQDHV